MKVIMLILIPVVSLLLISCEKERTEKVTVIKDCTGSYLRFDGKDYLICNREKAEPFSDGTIVTATFKAIKNCTGSAKDAIVCMMYHQNEGWIEVEKIQ